MSETFFKGDDMKKLLKFILKQFIKCFIFIFVSAICFYCCSHVKAYANYTRTITVDFPANSNRTDIIDISGAISIIPIDYTFSSVNGPNEFKYSFQSGSYPSFSNNFTLNTPISVDSNTIIRFRCQRVVNGSVQSITMTTFTYQLVLPGSDPDLGVKSQEQRYNTTTFYSSDFTKSNSLPLIYTGSLFLSDFTPNGNCNSVQVDASTVGGDQLEWRLNLGQSGIDGQTAWLPIGFKMPLQVNQFDEHSIQLRMKDPDNPDQYYNLDPSELSICSVTYGYMTDVYFSLPPGEEQEVDTTDFGIEVPTMDFSGGEVAQVDGLTTYISTIGNITLSILNFSGLNAFVIFMVVVTAVFFFIL